MTVIRTGPLAHAQPYAQKSGASELCLGIACRSPRHRVWRDWDSCAGARVAKRRFTHNRCTSWLQRGIARGLVPGAAQPDSRAAGAPRDLVGRHLSAPLPAAGTLSHPRLSDAGAERVSSDRHPGVHPGACARTDDERGCPDRYQAKADGPGRDGKLHARSRRLVRLRSLRRSRPQSLRIGGRGHACSCHGAG
jgi:hypothetical protein